MNETVETPDTMPPDEDTQELDPADAPEEGERYDGGEIPNGGTPSEE